MFSFSSSLGFQYEMGLVVKGGLEPSNEFSGKRKTTGARQSLGIHAQQPRAMPAGALNHYNYLILIKILNTGHGLYPVDGEPLFSVFTSCKIC
jgi:hypothetical protein